MTGEATAAPGPRLSRVTVNLTARAVAALDTLTAASGGNRTDAIAAAVRVAATLLPLTHPDGTVHVTGPDGARHVVHLP